MECSVLTRKDPIESDVDSLERHIAWSTCRESSSRRYILWRIVREDLGQAPCYRLKAEVPEHTPGYRSETQDKLRV